MGVETTCTCDRCGEPIDVSDGHKPARLNVWPPTPAEYGHQQDEHWLCNACWDGLCGFFPKAKEAERFAMTRPAAKPSVELPPPVNETDKQLLVALAQRLGLKIEEQ